MENEPNIHIMTNCLHSLKWNNLIAFAKNTLFIVYFAYTTKIFSMYARGYPANNEGPPSNCTTIVNLYNNKNFGKDTV